MQKEIERLLRLSKARGSSISKIMEEFEKLLKDVNVALKEKIIDEFLLTLDIEDGKIANTNSNLRKINDFNKIWDSFVSNDLVAHYSRIADVGGYVASYHHRH